MVDLEELMVGVPVFGCDFHRRRKLLGLSLRQVAEELAVTPPTVARWEASDRPFTMSRRARWNAAMQQAALQRGLAVREAIEARRDDMRKQGY
jgi:transcriptional regulator with XRE-family HTH domain